MSERSPSLLGDAIRQELTAIVRDAVREAMTAKGNGAAELLEPEELAERLKVPISWVYEQSRHGAIPTHRIGRYIRFDLTEVLESQKKKESMSPLTRIK